MRWADSLSAGRTLTLRLDEEGDLHPFKGIPAGQRMQIAVVLVNDDEEPIGPEQVKKNSTRHKARLAARVPAKPEPVEPASEKPRLRSNLAAILCKENAEFQRWMYARVYGNAPEPVGFDPASWTDRDLKATLGIASKRELDTDPAAAERFDRLTTSFAHRNTVR